MTCVIPTTMLVQYRASQSSFPSLLPPPLHSHGLPSSLVPFTLPFFFLTHLFLHLLSLFFTLSVSFSSSPFLFLSSSLVLQYYPTLSLILIRFIVQRGEEGGGGEEGGRSEKDEEEEEEAEAKKVSGGPLASKVLRKNI